MRHRSILVGTVVLCLLCSLGLEAQQSDSSVSNNSNPPASSQSAAGTVPRLIKFSGQINPAPSGITQIKQSEGGKNPLPAVVGVTFSLYELQEGGSALWSESQKVQVDEQGRYTVLLGATQPEGLPLDLFTTGKALWVGVQPQLLGAGEQPRVLLVAVPYALKSSDADTLGGLPASAYMLSANQNKAEGSSVTPLITTANGQPSPGPDTGYTISGSGTANYVAMFTGTSAIANSAIYNSTGGNVGIGNANPAGRLDVSGGAFIRGTLQLPATGAATKTSGFSSNTLDLLASSFNSKTSAAVAQLFRWKAEPAANDTGSPSGTLNLLYLSGAGTPAETGLSIAGNGQIKFASGQTFPGTGTITGVTAGTDLSGGGTTGTVTLNLNTTKVPTLAATSNIFTGSITATSFTGSGAGLTNLTAANISAGTASINITGNAATATNALSLGGVASGSYARLDIANSFAGTQTVKSGDVSVSAGNLDLPWTASASTGVINMNGAPFIHACCSVGQENTFLGSGAGNLTTTGSYNTASGYQALGSITTGAANTASGYWALVSNTTGVGNTASGWQALNFNMTGEGNTAMGDAAMARNTTGNNNSAIGASALFYNDAAGSNTAVGASALQNNCYNVPTICTANNNTALGFQAGSTTVSAYANVTGAKNTFIGSDSGLGVPSSTTINNATAIGANAVVSASNALVLGSINGINGATASVNVGIGTPSPTATLEVNGTGKFDGLVTFESGQTFPGTVTSVGSGAGLTGGPITGTGTLSIASGGVTNAMLANPSLTVTAGTGLTGGGAVALGGSVTLKNGGVLNLDVATGSGLTTTGGQIPTLGIDNYVIPALGLTNIFTANQLIHGGYLKVSGIGNSVAYYGINNSTDSSHPTLWLENDDSTSATDLVFETYGSNYDAYCTIDIKADLSCSGKVGTVVKTSDNRQVKVYTVQSSENWIEDFGSGALVNGAATINIEPQFAKTVTTDASYHVFLTPNGDCEGLYVSQKGAASFEVHELKGGKSNVQFDYRIVAHREGFEAERLTDVTATFGKKVQLPTRAKAALVSQH